MTDWRERANCVGLTAIFFPERGEPGTEARAVCAGCEVREQCLEEGLTTTIALGERHSEYVSGIWGGRSGNERRQIRAQRARRRAEGRSA